MAILTAQYSLKLSPKDRDLLAKIAEQDERSPADIVRTLVRQEAAKRKIDVTQAQPQSA